MGLKIFWTDFSKSELRRIFNYHKEIGSLKIARRLVTGITQEVSTLQSQPKIGQKEEYLIGREQEFRYIVYKNYKVIYWQNIRKNRIEITDIFDTRQNPVKMNRTQ
jgi:plasmid stabilization system protein ParE